jgi:PPOX class probable F420-dependent enzyme
MRLDDRSIDSLVAGARLARLAIPTRAGHPLLVPIVYVVRDGCLWSPIDGKPKRSADVARLRHVEMHPDASILIDHYDEDWTRLWWVRIDVIAAVVREDELPARELDAIAEALRGRYPQYATTPLFTGPPVLLHLRPLRRTGWSAR